MKHLAPVFVVKANGEREEFSVDKLRHSLKRSGASKPTTDEIIHHVEGELHDGMTTAHIYEHAFSLLKDRERFAAARYNVKQAIRELGPDGFPFERLISEIMKAEGYSTKVGQTVQGNCVEHEVDVVAAKDDEVVYAECKFHNQSGVKTNVKVALYVKARFDDLKEAAMRKDPNKKYSMWLVTNTRLTVDAIRYAQCQGLKVMSWDYPTGNNLEDKMNRYGIHPITCLPSLDAVSKRKLLDNGAILCKEATDIDLLRSLKLDEKQINRIQQEASLICGSPL